jgi:hypothetical protein
MPYERIVANTSGDFRREELEGRPHLVAPCVMLVEGVVNGSGGPYFYPAEENGKNPSAWDHMPIVVYHPEKNGENVSARQPEFLNTRKIGVLLNTQHVDKKLRTECWFDEERTKEIDNRIYEAILNKQPVEVSTGLGLEAEMTRGKYNDQDYIGIARNHSPDHLAILPDKVGACSIKMGGGLFANSAKEPEFLSQIQYRSVENALRRIGVDLATNVLSFSRVQSRIAELLATKYGDRGTYWHGWVSECYPSTVIFYDKEKMWAQNYAVTGEEVSLEGNRTEVVRTTEYKTVDGKKTYAMNSQNQMEEISLPDPEVKMAFDKKTYVNTLIGQGFEETDRSWLEAMPEDQLQKIKPAAAPVQTPPAIPVVGNQLQAQSAPQVSLKQLIANADPATQAMFADMEASHNAEKGRLVEKIANAQGNTFPKEALQNMTIPNLRAIAGLVPDQQPNHLYDLSQTIPGLPAGPYAGAVGFASNAAGNVPFDEPPLPPEITFDAPKSNI